MKVVTNTCFGGFGVSSGREASGVVMIRKPNPPPRALVGERRVGAVIRSLRELEGWTQVQLGRYLGIGRGAVAHLEAGRRPLSFSVAVRLTEILPVNPFELREIWRGR